MNVKLPIAACAVALLSFGAVFAVPVTTSAQTDNPPKATPRPRKTPVKRRVVRATPTPAPTAQPIVVSRVELRSDRMGYDWWGRPAAMDTSGGRCSQVDDKRRALRLEASFQISNNSAAAIAPEDYWVQFYKSDGSKALTCYWAYSATTPAPTIGVGQTANMTFMAFVEPGERVAFAELVTRASGRGERVNVPFDLSIPNQ